MFTTRSFDRSLAVGIHKVLVCSAFVRCLGVFSFAFVFAICLSQFLVLDFSSVFFFQSVWAASNGSLGCTVVLSFVQNGNQVLDYFLKIL